MTVRQLLEGMDSRELSEWMAYEQVEPFGDMRGDLQAGVVASTIANVNRGKMGKRLGPSDFLLKFGEKPTELSAEDTLSTFMGALGLTGRVSDASGQVTETGPGPDADEDAERAG